MGRDRGKRKAGGRRGICAGKAEVYLDLRFLPLVNVGLSDLKVDTLDASSTAHDLNAAQVRLKVVEDTLCLLQEPLQPTTK